MLPVKVECAVNPQRGLFQSPHPDANGRDAATYSRLPSVSARAHLARLQ